MIMCIIQKLFMRITQEIPCEDYSSNCFQRFLQNFYLGIPEGLSSVDYLSRIRSGDSSSNFPWRFLQDWVCVIYVCPPHEFFLMISPANPAESSLEILRLVQSWIPSQISSEKSRVRSRDSSNSSRRILRRIFLDILRRDFWEIFRRDVWCIVKTISWNCGRFSWELWKELLGDS